MDPWKFIDKNFKEHKDFLIKHQIDSYNQFLNQINSIFKENNPIKIFLDRDENSGDYNCECHLYMGGKDGSKIYFGKPVMYENKKMCLMYPNSARLKNMSYNFTIHYDVDVEYLIKDDTSNIEETNEKTKKNKKESDYTIHSDTVTNILLGRFPVMLQSDMCILKGLNENIRYNMGECRNDYGGYFIIDGKEKAIISQEKFADNLIYLRDKVNDKYSHSAEIRTVSEDSSKPMRKFGIYIVTPSSSYTNDQIVVNIPNVRQPIPLFIVMRALGIISDRDIIQTCLLDLEKNSKMIDCFIPSVHDAANIFTQSAALEYIKTFTKGKTIATVMEILMNYLLPNIGELNFKAKAYFIGHMVYRLLNIKLQKEKVTDRDNFKYKRVDTPGILLYNLFKEYYNLQRKNIFQTIDKEYYYNPSAYNSDFTILVRNNVAKIFKEKIVEEGFRRAFKGNWGSTAHTKKEGIVQDLNRLSYNSFISHMRKLNLPFDSSSKIVGPRLLHNSQWGYIDPVDTPDGGNIGLHKHMAISTRITKNYSMKKLVNWLISEKYMVHINNITPDIACNQVKIFINGSWLGCTNQPRKMVETFKIHRRNGLINSFFSISWEINANIIYFFTDGGRLIRPIFNLQNGLDNLVDVSTKIATYSWNQLIGGFKTKTIENYRADHNNFYSVGDIYKDSKSVRKTADLIKYSGVVDYIDPCESETVMIALNTEKITNQTDYKINYTHLEIHPSLMFGVMGNQIIFPENNPCPRNIFSCGQSKQAVSIYHSNFTNRIDKMGVVLNYGQKPLIKSRYLNYINKEEHPYGINAIVAIMVYTSYNVEDAVLFNEGAINRGIFRTTYYNMYEDYEESSKVSGSTTNTQFTNIEKTPAVIGKRPGYDYSVLDDNGVISENTKLDEKCIIIGKTITNNEDPDKPIDSSTVAKKGQMGFVDKTFVTTNEEGFRIAKVRVRDERIPAIGDKFCSRCGQKGTIGNIIPEKDMPFTKEGIRPDIIVNPHAIPSRMTIGQFVECLYGKAGACLGAFSDCTAFTSNGSKHVEYGNILKECGYHSSGNEILYSGVDGRPLKSEIFIGPTYYMRLKHMVKDKVNYRARGPRTSLTRQTVQGRANDGGLRVGEMERDCLISHGAAKMLEDSMMTRGDEYYMAICNQSGTFAIYNETKNIFLSPSIDGPIKFEGDLDTNLKINQISKYGRNFSVIRIPYSFKLMMQELLTMNVKMNIITEKNISNFDNMTVSNNVAKLLFDENDKPKLVIRDKIEPKTSTQSILNFGSPSLPIAAPDTPPSSPPYQPTSPTVGQVDSPPYNPNTPPSSPPYQPTSPTVGQVYSPPYDPNTPPISPPYQPTSPTVGQVDSPPYNPNSSGSSPYQPNSPTVPSSNQAEGELNLLTNFEDDDTAKNSTSGGSNNLSEDTHNNMNDSGASVEKTETKKLNLSFS